MISVATALAINCCGLVDSMARWDGLTAMPMSMPSVMVEHWGAAEFEFMVVIIIVAPCSASWKFKGTNTRSLTVDAPDDIFWRPDLTLYNILFKARHFFMSRGISMSRMNFISWSLVLRTT